MLGLKHGAHHDIEIPPQQVLVAHFGKYLVSAKTYRTKGIPNEFFGELAKFLLEITCVHPHNYGMPKKKVGIIITTYTGGLLDWGSITGEALRAGLYALQAGKKLIPALAHYLFVPYPPHSVAALRKPLVLHAPSTDTKRQRALQFSQVKWKHPVPSTTSASPRPTQTTKEPEPIVVATKDSTIRGHKKSKSNISIA